MIRILVTDGMDPAALAELRADGYEVVEQFYGPEELGAALREFDAVVVRSKTKLRQKQLDAARGGQLKLIIRGGVGVDNIDVAYAEQAGIAVRNTPKASSQSVAELALAHMFSCARFISDAGYTMRQGKWEKKAYGKGMELAGKTLGIIGMGRIGQRLASMARAIGMEVIARDSARGPEIEAWPGVSYMPLDDVLARADVLSIHTPAVAGRPLIDRDAIAKMKDGAILINTSRGSNVDEDALLEALNSGKLRAAGLDVFVEEPTKNEALYLHPHVSVTPHIGGATVEAQFRIGEEIVELVRTYFNKSNF